MSTASTVTERAIYLALELRATGRNNRMPQCETRLSQVWSRCLCRPCMESCRTVNARTEARGRRQTIIAFSQALLGLRIGLGLDGYDQYRLRQVVENSVLALGRVGHQHSILRGRLQRA